MSEIVADPRARDRFPVGWWGMALLIASEAALFGMMVGSYFFLRFKNLAWPPPGVPKPNLLWPLVLLGILIVTAVPMQAAARSVRPRRWLLLALLVQVGYLVVELVRYHDDLAKFGPQDGAYGSLYYTLLGADHAHVAVGILLDVWLLWKLLGGMTRYRRNALRAVALYWYAVIVLTIVVTLTVLSPSFA